MFQFTQGRGGVTFAVRIVPRASSSEIIGEHDGALKIRIAAPPVEGEANRELVRFLARRLRVRQDAITIVSGARSKSKIVSVDDATAATLDRLKAF